MVISNFRDKFRTQKCIYATVDVTYTTWWFKKETKTQTVFSEVDRLGTFRFWRFLETGDYTPDLVVEGLNKVYEAMKILEGEEDE